ncbi:unnamed protein product [Leptosia nina]|uniref:Uncharacterized protein n=1 Tax=Leptosia nina TaxID=320188 RepID=A0AAV1JBR5_9NEOP
MLRITGLDRPRRNPLSLQDLVQSMVSDESKWKAVQAFCEEVLKAKEDNERAREIEPGAPLQRRRRTGRRRRNFANAPEVGQEGELRAMRCGKALGKKGVWTRFQLIANPLPNSALMGSWMV